MGGRDGITRGQTRLFNPRPLSTKSYAVSTDCNNDFPPVFSTFSPGGRFAFNRGYWRRLFLVDRSTFIEQHDNELICHSADLPDLSLHYVIDPRVWEWSTNRYTLDHFICSSWYQFAPTYEKFAWGCSVEWCFVEPSPLPCLRISAIYSALYTTELSVPPPPADYWAR